MKYLFTFFAMVFTALTLVSIYVFSSGDKSNFSGTTLFGLVNYDVEGFSIGYSSFRGFLKAQKGYLDNGARVYFVLSEINQDDSELEYRIYFKQSSENVLISERAYTANKEVADSVCKKMNADVSARV